MSEYLQAEYKMCRDIHDIIKLKGWEFLINRLYLLAKYGYEHETLEAALFAARLYAERCDRQTEKSGLFPPEPPPPPKKTLRARVRRRKKKTV